jgi:hypothetical protein
MWHGGRQKVKSGAALAVARLERRGKMAVDGK